MVTLLTPADRLKVLDHLSRFTPDMRPHIDLACWAIRTVNYGAGLSTRLMGDRVVSAFQVVEQLRLGDFLDKSDPWAPA